MGTIVSVTAKQIVIKTTDGPEKTAEIVALTTLHKGKDKGAQADLKAGLKVVLNVGDGKEPLKAKDIQYVAAPATTAMTPLISGPAAAIRNSAPGSSASPSSFATPPKSQSVISTTSTPLRCAMAL